MCKEVMVMSSDEKYDKMILNMLDNLDVKELIELGKQVCEKYNIKGELREFFQKEVVEVPVDKEVIE
jgi:aromatic ring-opening dioxygenase LigB subunit